MNYNLENRQNAISWHPDFQGVDERLFEANINLFGDGSCGLHWEDVREKLIAPALAQTEISRRGYQRQPGHSTEAKHKLRQRYAHLKHGGWMYSGANGQVIVKPNRPRIDSRGKIIKYESQPGGSVEQIRPVVPHSVACELLGLDPSTTRPFDFWARVRNTDTPLVVTEGVKDTLAWLSAGTPAMGVIGITCWGNTGTGLRDHWEPYRKTPRDWVVAFDSDEKETTRIQVKKQARIFSRRLHRFRGKYVLVQDGTARDASDILKFHGADALKLQLKKATREGKGNVLNNIFDSYAEDVDVTATGNIIGNGPIGSGKTTRIAAKVVESWSGPVIALTHRRALNNRLAESLGLVNLNDVVLHNGFGYVNNERVDLTRVVLCIDSLQKLNAASFRGALVIIDEVDQVLQHLGTSATVNARRLQLAKRFNQIREKAGKLVLLDAHADRDAIAEFFPGTEFTWLGSRRRMTPNRVFYYDCPSKTAIFEVASQLRNAGKRLLVACDSRNAAIQLHEYIGGDGQVIADNFEADISPQDVTDSEICRKYPYVIYTPRISSGTSIEHDAFDAVIGLFTHSYNARLIEQSLGRNRRPVDRHVWVSQSSRRLPCNGLVERARILEYLKTSELAAIQHLRGGLATIDPADFQDAQYALGLYTYYTARNNRDTESAFDDVASYLQEAQHQVEVFRHDGDKELSAFLAGLLDDIKSAHAADASSERLISGDDLQTIKAKDRITAAERAETDKFVANKVLPGVTDPADIKWALGDGSKSPKARLMFDKELSMDRTRVTLGGATQDVDRAWHQSEIRRRLGLREMASLALSGARWCNSTAEVVMIADHCRQNQAQIERQLHIKIGEKDTNITIVHKLLRQIGFKPKRKNLHIGKVYELPKDQIRLLQWSISYQHLMVGNTARDNKKDLPRREVFQTAMW